MKNKPFFYLLLTFIILNVSDVITTFFIIEGESNPLYLLTGNIWIIHILKLLVILLLIRYYKRNIYPTQFSYYMMINIITLGCLVLLLAQIININAIINTEYLEAAAQTTSQERATSYFWFVNLFYLVPLLMSLLNFWLYQKSIKKVEINKKYYKNRAWWKI